MVRAGAGFRQAEGDVHGVVEVQQLERDEPLVMVHCNDGVEVAAGGVAENRVGHGGAGEGGGPGIIEARDGGLDDAGFLVAEGSVFPGVGVEAGDGDAGAGNAAAFQEIRGEAADADDALGGEQRGDAGERFVDGGEPDGEGAAGQQHAEVSDAEGVCEKLGLAGKRETERLQRILADRGGDDGIRLARLEHGGRLVKCGEGGGGGAAVGLAWIAGVAVAEQDELTVLRKRAHGEGLLDDFRADSGGVSEGDGDAWHGWNISAGRRTAKRGMKIRGPCLLFCGLGR